MKRFLTGIDIEFLVQQGTKEIPVDEDTVVTAIARETAERLGATFRRPSPPPVVAPSVVAPPVAPAVPVTLVEELVRAFARNGPVVHSPREADLAVNNARIVLPGEGIIEGSLEITGGRVTAISAASAGRGARVIDAGGRHAFPGVFDPHIHLGIFGDFAEELRTESASALLGGVTTAGCMLGAAGSHLQTMRDLERLIGASSIDLVPHLIITTEEQLREIPRYVHELGVTSFKLFMYGVPGIIQPSDDGFLLEAFAQIRNTGRDCTVCIHAENAALVARATAQATAAARPDDGLAQWAETHPALAEEEAIRRAAFLAGKAGVPVYFVHVSSAAGVQALAEVRRLSPPVYAETTSPYLTLTAASGPGNLAKMEPPFRGQADVDALWQAVLAGQIDTVGTDNVTIRRAEKRPGGSVWEALPGYPALATHLPAMLDEGVHRRGLAPDRLAELLCRNPARIFGLYPRKGTLLPGSDADLVLVDLDLAQQVVPARLGSRADFSLYEGRTLRGWPVLTIKGGQVVAEGGRLVGGAGGGRVLRRG